MTPNDPLFPEQWHFPLIGDIQTVWLDFTGAGVSVVVVDDGLEYTHPDLAANYDASLHYTYQGVVYDPDPINRTGPVFAVDAHGTAVAGLIGAVKDNATGGTGVAPGVTLTGINYISDLQFAGATIEYDALLWARNFDIMNNSWGLTTNFQNSQGLANPRSMASRTLEVYGEVVDQGRDGLGTIIVQAAGNSATDANGEAINASRLTVTVAATEADGFIASYSSYGPSILIAAPAAAYTTDLIGTDGYNRAPSPEGDYTVDFGGTSAATPVTAGVIALMLEANPALGARDVQKILAVSAAQTGSAYGGPGAGFEVGAWGSNGATTWNGGGMSFHLSYGFGMVDAYAAVRMAEVWHILQDGPATLANEAVVSVFTDQTAPILDLQTTEVSIEVTEDILVENLQVNVQLTHSFGTDMVITLVSPTGEEVPLLVNAGQRNLTGGWDWTFGVTAAMDMTSAGTWTLRIEDTALRDEGELQGFGIDFHGSPLPAAPVLHYTSDFPDLLAAEPGRGSISAPDGHVGWLNLAAIPDDLAVNLGAGGGIAVAGTAWASLAAGTTVGGVVAGDGDDFLRGDAGDNSLHGGRGDDVLVGGMGDDLLHGGPGNDVLNGGPGRDTLFGGDGDDRLRGEGGPDVLYGEAGNDILIGDAGNDRLYGGPGRDSLFGGAGNDLLEGGGGNDVLNGGPGNDTLIGGDGADRLRPGAGDDLLTGGAGPDIFIFAPRNDSNVITDFDSGTDRLFLSEAMWEDVLTPQQVVAEFASVSGDDLVLDFAGAGTRIVLDGLGGTDPFSLADDILIVL